jgi:hypothetical protein
MHPALLAITALDLARERAQEGERHARLLRDVSPRPARARFVRRRLARVAARVSVSAAALADRLEHRPDARLTEQTGRRLPV